MEYQLKKPLFLPTEDKEYSAVERVFMNRGMSPESVQHYLNVTEQDLLNPELLAHIKDGAKVLMKHIAANDIIFVLIDVDCDGMTSSAALINYLNMLFPAYTQSHVIYYMNEGKVHGINAETVPDNVKLVICPDSSSNNYEDHKILRERGCDVLVLDHHLADHESEDAIIINNQMCDYPNKTLSGVGIVYKFCSYLDSLLGTNYAKDILDLTAVGIIADVMDLRDFETRYIVKQGLSHFRNPFLKELAEHNEYSISRAGGLSPFSVGWYIAPQINAIVRSGTAAERMVVFKSMLEFNSYDQVPSTKRGCKGQYEALVTQAVRTCVNVKNRQSKVQDQAFETIERIIQNKELLNNKIVAVKLDNEHAIDRNLSGLVANKLVAAYNHPVLILSEVDTDEGIKWEGSGRGTNSIDFNDFKGFLDNSELVNWAEGHSNAFGASVSDSNFDSLIEYSNKELESCDFRDVYLVDLIFDFFNFKANDIISIAELNSLWGSGIEKPLIAIENIEVTEDNLTLMSPTKSPTLKIKLPNGVELIKFKASEEEFESLKPTPGGSTTISIVGSCDLNVWNGNTTGQIKIEEYEVIGSKKYYF